MTQGRFGRMKTQRVQLRNQFAAARPKLPPQPSIRNQRPRQRQPRNIVRLARRHQHNHLLTHRPVQPRRRKMRRGRRIQNQITMNLIRDK